MKEAGTINDDEKRVKKKACDPVFTMPKLVKVPDELLDPSITLSRHLEILPSDEGKGDLPNDEEQKMIPVVIKTGSATVYMSEALFSEKMREIMEVIK